MTERQQGTLAPTSEEKAIENVVRNASTSPGHELPNGATILAQEEERRNEMGREYIVLAVHRGYQPFVIWRRLIGIEQKADGHSWGPLDYCWAGEYHKDLGDALASYQERTTFCSQG